MKKFLICLLCLLLCFSGWGCSQSHNNTSDILFYYRPSVLTYGKDAAAIRSEVRPDVQPSQPLEEILSVYLNGPESTKLSSPFPPNVTVISAQQEGNLFSITLSSQFSSLKGLNLVIACGCLTMTILEMTDATDVRICAQASLLDGSKSITMNRSSILLLDTSAQAKSE